MNHKEAQELLADLALNLLDGDESERVREHLATCADCRAELQVYLQAGDALTIATEDAEVPPGLADRIVAGVRARVHPPEPSLRPAPSRETLRIIPGPWRAIAVGAAAAAFLLAVGLTAVSFAWLDAKDDRDRLESQLAARAIELPLSGDGVSGVIYVASDFKSGVATFAGLGPAPAQHHYEVWSEGPAGARAATAFNGNGELVVSLPELPRDMTRMFVTIEPDGAVGREPTGPEVLSTPR